MKSILQEEKCCYVTGRTDNLHKHHIFYGSGNRKISEKNGFWVWLTGEYHNQDSQLSVHLGNVELDMALKEQAQKVFEKTHSRDEFMRLIGRNYLD